MYVNGSITTFGGSQSTPALTVAQREHLGEKAYNVIFLRWKHKARPLLIYYHQKHNSGATSPYVQGASNGIIFNFGGRNTSFAFNGEPLVSMVIYNDDKNIYALLTVDGGQTWQRHGYVISNKAWPRQSHGQAIATS